MKQIILIFGAFFFGIIGLKAQPSSNNFCQVTEAINSATNDSDVFNALNGYIDYTLNFHVDQYNDAYYGPLHGNRAVSYKNDVKKNILKKAKSLNQKKKAALEVVSFLNDVCDIYYTEDAAIRYFKILQKVIDYAKVYAGPYGFILEITKIYLEVGIKAIELVRKIQKREIVYWLNEPSWGYEFYIKLFDGPGFFKNVIKPGKYLSKISVEIVSSEGGVYKVWDVSDGSRNYTKSDNDIKESIRGVVYPTDDFTSISCTTCDMAIRIKVNPNTETGESRNTIYIPLDLGFAYKFNIKAAGEPQIFFKLFLVKGDKNINEYSMFQLKN